MIEGDIDGERAETTELETKEPRFGAVNAARRVARTIFLGSAPSSVATKSGTSAASTAPACCSAASSRARRRPSTPTRSTAWPTGCTTSTAPATRRTTPRVLVRHPRQPPPRDGGPEEAVSTTGTTCASKIAEVLKKLASGADVLRRRPSFTPHADVPDDSALRLVVLPPEQFYTREETRLAFEAVLDYVRNNGTKPRYRGNRLIFLAPDHGALARLRDASVSRWPGHPSSRTWRTGV